MRSHQHTFILYTYKGISNNDNNHPQTKYTVISHLPSKNPHNYILILSSLACQLLVCEQNVQVAKVDFCDVCIAHSYAKSSGVQDKLCKQIKTLSRQVIMLFIIKRHETNLVNGCLH